MTMRAEEEKERSGGAAAAHASAHHAARGGGLGNTDTWRFGATGDLPGHASTGGNLYDSLGRPLKGYHPDAGVGNQWASDTSGTRRAADGVSDEYDQYGKAIDKRHSLCESEM
jgi:hypothetical protein